MKADRRDVRRPLTKHQIVFALLRSLQIVFAAGGLGAFTILLSYPRPHAVAKAPVIAMLWLDPKTLVEYGAISVAIALAFEPLARFLSRRWRNEINGWFV